VTLKVEVDRHAGGGWEDWSDYVFPLTSVTPESRASAESGTAPVRFVDPPATPLKDWGLKISGVTTFEGLIDTVKHSDEDQPGSAVVEDVTATDYTALLDMDVVPRCWRSVVETDKERLTWLIQTYGTHGITCGDEVQEIIGQMPGGADGKPEQEFGPSGLREAASKITALTGGKLNVDYSLRLHHFIDEVDAAPFNLSDDPNGTTTRDYFDFSLEDDNVPKVDQVVVFGCQLEAGAGLLTVTRTAPDAPAAAYRRIAPLVNDKLTSIAQCEAAGDAFLLAHRPRRAGKLKTVHAGLLAGQTVQITHAAHGLDAEPFRIVSVKPTPDTPDTAVYDVGFGDERLSQASIIGGSGGLADQIAGAAGVASDASRKLVDLSVGGANLVANSFFGNALGTTWTVGANWVFGYTPVSPELALWGSKTARATLAAQTAGELVTAPVPVARLDDYWFSVWTWIRAWTSGTVRIELREYNAADALLASTTIADLAAAETGFTAHRLHMGPNDELGRTGFDADTVAVRLAIFTAGASTLTCDVGGVQAERGRLATAYAPMPSEIADGSIDAATKLIAYSIVAGLVAAGTMTADKFAATLAWVSKLVAGDPAAGRIELDGTLANPQFAIYSPTNELMVRLGTDGAPMYFNGDLVAQTLTLIGAGEIRGAMSLAKDAVMTVQTGVQAPSAAPVLAQGLPATLALAQTNGWSSACGFAGDIGDAYTATGGGFYDPVGGADGATPCYVGVEADGLGSYRVTEWKRSDGTISRTTAITGWTAPEAVDGITRIGTSWYLTGGSPLLLIKVTRATGAYVGELDISARFLYGQGWQIGTDGTALYIVGWATTALTMRVVKCSAALAYVSSTTLAVPGAPGGKDWLGVRDFGQYDDGDGNGVCYWLDLVWADSATWGATCTLGEIYQFKADGSLVASTDWPEKANSMTTSGWWPQGLVWDGTQFCQFNSSDHTLQPYTNWSWTTATVPYWAGHAWYDDAAPTHETPISPRASITMTKRRQLTVTTPTIPVGGADDPNKVRIYMLPNATDPGAGNFKLQATDALTARTLTTYNAAGGADGAGTAFPGGAGGRITTPTHGWDIRANDTGSVPAAVGVAAIAGQAIAPASETVAGQMVTSGILSVSLTASVNNWNPAGLATCSCIVIRPNAAWDITGIVAQAHGFRLRLFNIGGFSTTLVWQSASSSVGNRFLGPAGANVVIRAYGSVDLVYDGLDANWCICAI
jgi:hypothetical protein